MSETDPTLKLRLRQIPSLKAPLPEMDFDGFPATPKEAFELWLADALGAGVREPHAMVLSTVDADGYPDARVLILKNIDERGWQFAIKAESPKAQQISTCPEVALTFYWPSLGRQIRIRGLATLLPALECAADYLDRPIGSRVSALASSQSEVLAEAGDLDVKLAEAKRFLADTPDFVSPGWQVFAVQPRVAEFWQGASDRNHKRLRFTAGQSGEWLKARLWP